MTFIRNLISIGGSSEYIASRVKGIGLEIFFGGNPYHLAIIPFPVKQYKSIFGQRALSRGNASDIPSVGL